MVPVYLGVVFRLSLLGSRKRVSSLDLACGSAVRSYCFATRVEVRFVECKSLVQICWPETRKPYNRSLAGNRPRAYAERSTACSFENQRRNPGSAFLRQSTLPVPSIGCLDVVYGWHHRRVLFQGDSSDSAPTVVALERSCRRDFVCPVRSLSFALRVPQSPLAISWQLADAFGAACGQGVPMG